MTRKFTVPPPRTIELFAAVLLLAQMAVTSAIAAEPAYGTWFKPATDAHQHWEFSEVAGDPLQLTIRRKPPGAEGRQRRVFVLFPKASSAYDAAMSKILGVFEDKDIDAEFTLFNFNKKPARGNQALELVNAGEFELIFSMGSQSTAWLWQNYRDESIPVVSICSKDPVVLGQTDRYDRGTGTNFAFTSLNMPIEVQMAYVLELKPNLKNLAVLVNSKNVSAMETQAKPIAEFARERGIRVLELAIQNPERAADELESMVREAVTVMRKNDPTLNDSLFWITGSTAVFREIETINANSDRVPVLSVVPDVVRAGDDSAVLSIGIGFESNAHLAAIYGLDVLDGRVDVGELEVGIVSPPDIAINFRIAREIGLEIPFSFFESASFIYDYDGRMVRNNGKPVTRLD